MATTSPWRLGDYVTSSFPGKSETSHDRAVVELGHAALAIIVPETAKAMLLSLAQPFPNKHTAHFVVLGSPPTRAAYQYYSPSPNCHLAVTIYQPRPSPGDAARPPPASNGESTRSISAWSSHRGLHLAPMRCCCECLPATLALTHPLLPTTQ